MENEVQDTPTADPAVPPIDTAPTPQSPSAPTPTVSSSTSNQAQAPAPSSPSLPDDEKTDRAEKDRELEDQGPVADDVVLAYHLVLKGGTEKVVEMKSKLVLPLALALENMPQTDISFPELVDQILVRPLVTKFRAFLQRRFDEASAAEAKRKAEAEPPPEPPPRRPVIDQALIDKQVAATIEALKPPLPRMPGRDWHDDKAKS